MSRVKTRASKQPRAKKELTLSQALERVNDPSLASHLSVFYDELARAQRHGDREGAQYARRAIADAMRGVADGPIDVPLLTAIRMRNRKRRRKV